jgi:hypothetical protein
MTTYSPTLRRIRSDDCDDVLLAFQQCADLDVEHTGNLCEREQADVELASFEARDVGRVQSSGEGELLLRPVFALGVTGLQNISTDTFEQRVR